MISPKSFRPIPSVCILCADRLINHVKYARNFEFIDRKLFEEQLKMLAEGQVPV